MLASTPPASLFPDGCIDLPILRQCKRPDLRDHFELTQHSSGHRSSLLGCAFWTTMCPTSVASTANEGFDNMIVSWIQDSLTRHRQQQMLEYGKVTQIRILMSDNSIVTVVQGTSQWFRSRRTIETLDWSPVWLRMPNYSQFPTYDSWVRYVRSQMHQGLANPRIANP